MKQINPSSKRQLFFKWIEGQLDSGIELKTPDSKKENYAKFLETNKFLESDYPYNVYSKTFSEVIKEKSMNPIDFGLMPKKKSQSSSSGLVGNIKDGSVETVHDIQVIDPDTMKKQAEDNSVKKDENGDTVIKYTAKVVGGFWAGLYSIFQMFVPDLENLSEDEKDSLGEVWLPIFQRYLAGSFMSMLTPLFMTASIFAGKFMKLRKSNEEKQKKLKQQGEVIENTIKESGKDEKSVISN